MGNYFSVTVALTMLVKLQYWKNSMEKMSTQFHLHLASTSRLWSIKSDVFVSFIDFMLLFWMLITLYLYLIYSYQLNIWDVGGQKSLRSYWRNYFESTDGLVWVVDSIDRRRMEDCTKELHSLLQEEVVFHFIWPLSFIFKNYFIVSLETGRCNITCFCQQTRSTRINDSWWNQRSIYYYPLREIKTVLN